MELLIDIFGWVAFVLVALSVFLLTLVIVVDAVGRSWDRLTQDYLYRTTWGQRYILRKWRSRKTFGPAAVRNMMIWFDVKPERQEKYPLVLQGVQEEFAKLPQPERDIYFQKRHRRHYQEPVF